MPFVIIRRATPADVDIVAEFNRRLAFETENIALDLAVLKPGVHAALSDPAKALYFLAEIGGETVGQTMVTYEWSDWRNGFLWWIGSVYVREDRRAKGVFTALHERVRAEALGAGAVGLRLYVRDDNERAQSVYRRLGMRAAGYGVLEQMFVEAPGSSSARS